MPHFGYSIDLEKLDKSKIAIASGRELPISFKAAREVCNVIRGMRLDEAKKILEEVINLKRPIPFKRFNKKGAHRKGLQGWHTGRYPVKVAKHILKVLENAEANAELKGLDLEKLWIKHICAQKGRKIKRYIPRAFGRSTPECEQLTHIEVVLEERE